VNQKLLALACLATLALSACNKPAEPAPAPAPADAPKAAEPAAPAPAPVAAAEPTAADAAAFAGTFRGTVPCADCEGIDTTLELKTDGSYALSRSYQGKGDGSPSKSDGTWTAEDNGKRVRLDPNSKSEDDSLFEVVSKDEIRMLDVEGKKIESEFNHSLKRTAAAQ